MSSLRRPKAVVTDFRPPGAGRGFPLERQLSRPVAAASGKTPWDFMAGNNQNAKSSHDLMVSGLPLEVMQAAAKDLGARHCWDRKNPEHRWVLDRLGALGRAIGKQLSPARG